MTTTPLSAIAGIRIRRPPADVFHAFADAAEMSKFWFTRRDDGLIEGEPCTWYLGSAEDAFSFEVDVIEVDRPHRLVIDWGHEDTRARVTWTFEADGDGHTMLRIEETGYTGDADAIVTRALDSTGGFNQVAVAAKAMLEYGAALNVVADHA